MHPTYLEGLLHRYFLYIDSGTLNLCRSLTWTDFLRLATLVKDLFAENIMETIFKTMNFAQMRNCPSYLIRMRMTSDLQTIPYFHLPQKQPVCQFVVIVETIKQFHRT